jgi:hypothetical protein
MRVQGVDNPSAPTPAAAWGGAAKEPQEADRFVSETVGIERAGVPLGSGQAAEPDAASVGVAEGFLRAVKAKAAADVRAAIRTKRLGQETIVQGVLLALERDSAACLEECIRLLKPSVLDTVETPDRGSCLHIASESGAIECIGLIFVHRKRVVRCLNAIGQTPLHVCKSEEVVDLLLQAGVDPTVVDDLGRTAVHCLAERGRTAAMFSVAASSWVARVSHPALFVDLPDAQGRTALHWAALRGELECVQRLLHLGASRAVKDSDGSSPLDLATLPSIIHLLRSLEEEEKLLGNVEKTRFPVEAASPAPAIPLFALASTAAAPSTSAKLVATSAALAPGPETDRPLPSVPSRASDRSAQQQVIVPSSASRYLPGPVATAAPPRFGWLCCAPKSIPRPRAIGEASTTHTMEGGSLATDAFSTLPGLARPVATPEAVVSVPSTATADKPPAPPPLVVLRRVGVEIPSEVDGIPLPLDLDGKPAYTRFDPTAPTPDLCDYSASRPDSTAFDNVADAAAAWSKWEAMFGMSRLRWMPQCPSVEPDDTDFFLRFNLQDAQPTPALASQQRRFRDYDQMIRKYRGEEPYRLGNIAGEMVSKLKRDGQLRWEALPPEKRPPSPRANPLDIDALELPLCYVCQMRQASLAIVPCDHCCVCRECAATQRIMSSAAAREEHRTALQCLTDLKVVEDNLRASADAMLQPIDSAERERVRVLKSRQSILRSRKLAAEMRLGVPSWNKCPVCMVRIDAVIPVSRITQLRRTYGSPPEFPEQFMTVFRRTVPRLHPTAAQAFLKHYERKEAGARQGDTEKLLSSHEAASSSKHSLSAGVSVR